MNFLTDHEVAAIFHISWEQVQARCRTGGWPHLKIGRKYLFRPEHVEQIAALSEVKPVDEPEETWGRKAKRAS